MAVLISLAIYFIVLIVISWYSRNASHSQDFVLGNRNVGLLGTMASQAVSSIDGTGLVIMTMWGILFGFGAAWVIPGVVIGFILFSWQAPRIREIALKYRALNVNDFLKHKIGSYTANLSVVLVMFVWWLATAGQLYVAGLIFHAASGWPQWVGITIGGAAVMLYTIIGGYVTLVRTDLFQWLAATIILAAAMIFADKPSIHQSWHQFTSMSIEWKLGLFLLPVFCQYAIPDTWQRIFSARNNKVARLATALIIPTNVIYVLGAISLGCTIRNAVGVGDAANAFYRYLSSPSIPGWVAGALGVLAMAKVMSSLDTRAYVVISMMTKNILGIDPDSKLAAYISRVRIITLVYFMVSILVAVFISDIVQYMMNLTSLLMLLGPPLCVAVYCKPEMKNLDKRMFAVLISGVILFLLMLATGNLANIISTMVPPIFTALLTATTYGIVVFQSNKQNANEITVAEKEAALL